MRWGILIGILIVGAKLYECDANIGQVIVFLIASPWNSFSLTLILIAFIGLPWTLAFTVGHFVSILTANLNIDQSHLYARV